MKRTPVQLFLPIANIPVNVLLILSMGAGVGFVSGLFGIGGGFLLTPLLIFIGISPSVAVATVASHIASSSFSGALSYWRRRAIDPVLVSVLLSGGIVGTVLGVALFALLRSFGQLDRFIALSYVALLGGIGGLMVWEGLRAVLRARQGPTPLARRPRAQGWILALPLKMRFKHSRIYLSVIPLIGVGLLVGFIGAIMGVGGGFLLIPILIYVLRLPTITAIGTSMILTLVTMTLATILHAVTNHSVDAVLALVLMTGGAIGAQFGVRAGHRIRGDYLRLLLGLLVLSVGIRFAGQLLLSPPDLQSVRDVGTLTLEIAKDGFDRFVANSARDYGLLYGLATALMAMMTGWFASVVFRRDQS